MGVGGNKPTRERAAACRLTVNTYQHLPRSGGDPFRVAGDYKTSARARWSPPARSEPHGTF
eukprot:1293118-Prymnesium_polylepis.1